MLAKLVDYGYFKPDVISSFDGGLGGCQFMPDSFYRYAVSYDGGKADIINNNKDVFASIGNYLYSTGWRHHEGILTEVVLPEGFDVCKAGMNTSKKVSEWKKMGVEAHPNGIGAGNMVDDEAKASVMIVDIDDTSKNLQEKRAFLVYDNYKVILGYNSMPKYGIVAGLIYEGIGNE
jgi:membrane-bound lytic murein transglycosylase B